jgi:biopolymer transport protein ExbB
LILPLLAQANWNGDWENQKKISINAAGVTPSQAQFPVVVRLHSGNFDFSTANADGSDLRFVAADDKTELKFHIEKYDSVNELAVIWVQLPKVDAADKDAHFWVYSGNEKATASADAKLTWDASTVAVFHFAEKALLQDSSVSALVATGEVGVQKSALIGEAAVFNGKPLSIATIPNLKGAAAYTWSAWVKPANISQAATLVSLGDTLSLKTDGVKLSLNGGKVSGGELKAVTWQHVALTVDGTKANLYINGISVASGDISAVDASSNIKMGDGYAGEIDEMQLANVARSPEWLKLSASAQGMDSQLLKIEESDDEEGGDGEPNYIAILISSLTIDAKVVIGILAVMFGISTWVMVKKAKLVSITDKDNALFLKRFQNAGNDLLSLDQGANYDNSTLYRLYTAGLREITKRQQAGQKLALSGAAMDAIKAAIDADLVRETQKQNAGMVLLTIAISGGPFLGLLGTVVGVMITFAAIAAAGDVNVNAIAPGIAAALLATVAGLAVAIPALFGYNYLASRIKNITIAMQIFVDEFVTRTAELYGKQ